MVNIFEGKLVPQGQKFAIVIGRFNDFIGSKLLSGALDELIRHGIREDDIDVYWVPGCFEIPLIAKKAAMTKRYNAIITLGAIIKGATSHYDLVCSELAKGIAQVSLSEQLPVLFGVLTVDNLQQAIERAGTKAGNKGSEAAKAAIEMVNLMEQFK